MEHLSPSVAIALVGYPGSHGRPPGGYGGVDRADVVLDRGERVVNLTHAGGVPESPARIHSPDEGRDGGGGSAGTQRELRGPSQRVRVPRGVSRATHGQGEVGSENTAGLVTVSTGVKERHK